MGVEYWTDATFLRWGGDCKVITAGLEGVARGSGMAGSAADLIAVVRFVTRLGSFGNYPACLALGSFGARLSEPLTPDEGGYAQGRGSAGHGAAAGMVMVPRSTGAWGLAGSAGGTVKA